MAFFHRKLYRQKPKQWGSVSVVQESIFRNAERFGMPAPTLYLPLWEGGGALFYNYGTGPTNGFADNFGAGEGWVNTPHGFGVKMLSTADGCIYVPEHLDYCPVSNTPFTFHAMTIKQGSYGCTKYKTHDPWMGEWFVDEQYVQICKEHATNRLRRSFTAPDDGYLDYGFTWDGGQVEGLIPYINGRFQSSTVLDDDAISSYPRNNLSPVTMGTGLYEGIYSERKEETALQLLIFKGFEASPDQIAYLSDNPYFLLHRQEPVFYSLPNSIIDVTATDITTQTTISEPSVTRAAKSVDADNITSSATISAPTLGVIRAVKPADVTTQATVSEPVSTAIRYALAASLLVASVLGVPDVGLIKSVSADTVSCQATISEPSIQPIRAVDSAGVVAQSTISDPSIGMSGTVCWGHDTTVDETNARDFTGNWTGTADIIGTGDAERVLFDSGEYIESETWNVGSGQMEVLVDKYGTGKGTPVVKYKQGDSEATCEADTWHNYSGAFACSGWAKVRIEAA